MIVVSIDVGIINMGLVEVEVNSQFRIIAMRRAEKIDITQLRHTVVSKEECALEHTRFMADRVAHFLQEYGEMFDGCDAVLIEKQPLGGIESVECLIFTRYRKKATLVQPRSMHKFFGIGHLDYEGRKEQTVKIAEKYVGAEPQWERNGRKHDIADAMCLLLFWCHRQAEQKREAERKQKIMSRVATADGLTVGELFEKYRYRGESKLI